MDTMLSNLPIVDARSNPHLDRIGGPAAVARLVAACYRAMAQREDARTVRAVHASRLPSALNTHSTASSTAGACNTTSHDTSKTRSVPLVSPASPSTPTMRPGPSSTAASSCPNPR